MISILLLILLCTPVFICTPNPNCTTESFCTCDLKGAWFLNLTGYVSQNGDSYIETYERDGITYRFYPCGVYKPWGNGCTTNDTACQYVAQEDTYFSLGKTAQYAITKAIADGIKSYIVIEYIGGTNGRMSSIRISCAKYDSLNFMGEVPSLDYNLELRTPQACPPLWRDKPELYKVP